MTKNKPQGISKSIGTKHAGTKSNQNYKKGKRTGNRKPSITKKFKGANTKLAGRIFTKGPMQVSMYDNTVKCILTYIDLKYDCRVHEAFE